MALERVYFHIGSPKTGTSVLQSHLQQNRRVLREKSFFYPSTVSPFSHLYWSFESHHLLTYAWAGWKPYTDYSPARFWERTQATCEEHDLKNLLLSAENTYWLPTQIVSGALPDHDEYWAAKRRYVERIHEDLKHYDTKIVVYLRRQDFWLETWFNQWIKNGTHIAEKIFPEFADRHDPLLDHAKHMAVWADVFGAENLLVRVYEKEQLSNGLLQDFLDTLGLGHEDEFSVRKQPRYNAHLDRETMEFMNICNSLNLDSEDSVWLRLHLRRVTGQFERQATFREQHLLSPDQRNALLDRYEESNAWVARTFLNREDGALFMAPRPEADSDWTNTSQISSEHVAQLMLSILFSRGSSVHGSLNEKFKKSRARTKNNLSRIASARLSEATVARLEQRLWDRHLWGE